MSNSNPIVQEIIPPAPAFCERLSREDAERLSKKITASSMMELGAKIQSDLEFHREKQNQSNLNRLTESIRLSTMLDEYFALDLLGQKAKMLDLFAELEKLRKNNNEYKSIVDRIQVEYQDEKDAREELDSQCESYIQEIGDLEKKISSFKLQIVEKNNIIESQNQEFVTIKRLLVTNTTKYKRSIMMCRIFITILLAIAATFMIHYQN